MAGHQTHEEQIKFVVRGLILLGIITMVEVFVALLAKGHISPSIRFTGGIGQGLYMLLMIGFSLYKAYFIIFFFMHMAYEVKGLAISVLLPTSLLIWALIAFFSEGNHWRENRAGIKEKNEKKIEQSPTPIPSAKTQGYLLVPSQSFKG